jgi:hypothetical protein
MTCNRPRMDCHVAALLAVTDLLGAQPTLQWGIFGGAAHFAVGDFWGTWPPSQCPAHGGDARQALLWRC